jgi:hypothetical protein
MFFGSHFIHFLASPPDATTKFVSTTAVNDFETCIILITVSNALTHLLQCISKIDKLHHSASGLSLHFTEKFATVEVMVCYAIWFHRLPLA